MNKIVLQQTFSEGIAIEYNYQMPEWLIKFEEVEYIDVQGACIENLIEFIGLPVKEFIFRNVKVTDEKKMLSSLEGFKELVNIYCDSDFYHLIKTYEKEGFSFRLFLNEDS